MLILSLYIALNKLDSSLQERQCYGLIRRVYHIVAYLQVGVYHTGPSEAVRHGGGRRPKNLQGEREKEKKGGKKEKRGEKGKKGRGEQETEKDELGLWV